MKIERPLTLYERLCTKFGFLPVDFLVFKRKEYEEAISFSNLEITPKQIFSFAILSSFLFFLSFFLVFSMLNLLSITTLLFTILTTALLFYYLLVYPFHYSKIFRVRASSEMVLAIIYMTVSMKISPNLENAVKFAAKNLRGPLGFDLRRMLWKVYTDTSHSFEYYYDKFIEKWKLENSEFSQALYLIKASTYQSPEKALRSLEEAVKVMIQGTRDRMKKYAMELNTPITLINALGILLPILTLTLLPLVSIFVSGFHPLLLVLAYNILLPFFVYMFALSYLEKIPYSFSPKNINIPISSEWRIIEKALPFIVSVFLFSLSAYILYHTPPENILEIVISSTLLAFSLIFGTGLYIFLYSFKRKIFREKIVKIEREFSTVLFYLGQKIASGYPLELAIKEIVSRYPNFEISKFFGKVYFNIKNLGMSLEKAVFDEKEGAIKKFPSDLIENVMHAIVEISKRGMSVASRAMVMISSYLRYLKEVEITLRETTAETTSTLELQGKLLAPLVAGIVVSLSGIIEKVVTQLGKVIGRLTPQISSYTFSLSVPFLSLGEGIPLFLFEIILGVYLIEIVYIIGTFVGFIKYGDDKIMKRYTIGEYLLLSSFIFLLVTISTFIIFNGLINIESLLP